LKFTEFDLHPQLQEGLTYMKFDNATPIQEFSIPAALNGKDLIACAQTGTGKTAAYVIPVLNKLIKARVEGVNALILAPTRELALQIDQQLEGFGYFLGTSSIAIYGGGDGFSFEREKKALMDGVDVVIATPGRLLMHINMGYVNFKHLQFLILDEADRMLDMGFYDDITSIINLLPKERQTLLFSATMPAKIRTLTEKILNNPEQISLSISKPADGIVQAAYLVYDNQKAQLVCELLKGKELSRVIIFTSTKIKVKQLEIELRKLKFNVKAIHSDLEQVDREEVMRDFRHQKFQVLVGTDVIARGIDIDGIDLVINYDVPGDAEDYVHRIGRTARADKTGVALTFINEHEQQKFLRIEQLLEQVIMKIPLPAHLGEAPVYTPLERKEKSRGPFKKKSFGNRKPFAKRK
jgi:ATP-dependent RNA helicase RhlE